jgi:hypothetical protein
MATEFEPPHLKNANGADLLLYPAFLAARVAGRFALLDIREVQITAESTRFIVHDRDIPPDAEVVGNTWKYVNKDGRRDRRFSINPTIPIVRYCKIFVRGEGLNEAWMVSNAKAGLAFGEAVQLYEKSLSNSAGEAEGIAPPSAHEWPELDLPENLLPPPPDWKTPLTFFAAVVVMLAMCGLAFKSSISQFVAPLQIRESTVATLAEKSSASEVSAHTALATSQSPLTASEIAEIQRLLKSVGFDLGPADGKAGPKTQNALSGWSRKRGIETPTLNRGTLELLRHEDAARRVK